MSGEFLNFEIACLPVGKGNFGIKPSTSPADLMVSCCIELVETLTESELCC